MFSISPENSVFKEKITFTKESEFFLMDKVHRSEFSFLYKNSSLDFNDRDNILIFLYNLYVRFRFCIKMLLDNILTRLYSL